jgi:hypothetical protein
MRRNDLFLYALLVLLLLAFLTMCSENDITDSDAIQEINFSIGFVDNIKTRVSTDNTFSASFENGDAIGIFIYVRDPEEKSSIVNNNLYVDNRKMTYNGSVWQLESPIYYTKDDVLLDIYAYYPYRENAVADALQYNASTGMADLLSASVLGIHKTDRQTVRLFFSHLLSMIQISIDKTNNFPDFDETFSVSFHGIISGEYNLETGKISNPEKGIIQLPFIDENDTENRSCRAWIPAQQIPSDVVFSFKQTIKGEEILKETTFSNPTTFSQGEVIQFHITLDRSIAQGPVYNVYDPYPKDGDYIGMVIEVYNGGINGKVISLIDLPDSKWANNEVSWVDCVDLWAGINNLMKVQRQSNWQTRFPAFYQCALYGDRWYLPAIEEAYPFLYHKIGEINQHLLLIPGGQALDINKSYFMSTEISQRTVYKIYPKNGSTEQMPKSDTGKIRAFYEF